MVSAQTTLPTQATPCERPSSRTIGLTGLGTATSGELSYRTREDAAELTNGVCIRGEGWTVEANSLQAIGVMTEPVVTASAAVLRVGEWTLESTLLTVESEAMQLTGVRFTGGSEGTVMGEAAHATYAFSTGEFTLDDVWALGRGYRVSGARATLSGETLVFDNAVATTCTCGPALYTVSAPELRVEEAGRVVVRNGVLNVGGAALKLAPELDLSDTSSLRLPVRVDTLEGVGRTLQLTRLPLRNGFALSAGVTGLGETRPSAPFGLLHINRPGLEAVVGRGPWGLQADVRVFEPLNDTLTVSFGLRNHLWELEDFLREGYVSFNGARTLTGPFGGDSLRLTGNATVAVSGQRLGDAFVVSPRAALSAEAAYASPETPLGRFGLRTGASVSVYPTFDRTQYGFRLAPSWRLERGPFTGVLTYDRLLTNSASPFSVRLDRLEPSSALLGSAALTDNLRGGGEVGVTTTFGYNFRPEPNKNSFRTLLLSARAAVPVSSFTLTPTFDLELARVLEPRFDPDTRAFVALGVGLYNENFGAGLYARYNLLPEVRRLDVLELSGSAPVHVGERITLEPFLALNVAGLVTGEEPLRVSGAGLSFTYRSCCGTVTAGYKQLRGEATTTLALEPRTP